MESKTSVTVNQVWVPYWEWEDFHAGMWRKVHPHEEAKMLKIAVDFTGDHVRYGSAMKEVVDAWPRTMINSLTNRSINKRAFLGHCAVCFKLGIPEYITRAAWKELKPRQQELADKVAQETVDQWLIRYSSL